MTGPVEAMPAAHASRHSSDEFPIRLRLSSVDLKNAEEVIHEISRHIALNVQSFAPVAASVVVEGCFTITTFRDEEQDDVSLPVNKRTSVNDIDVGETEDGSPPYTNSHILFGRGELSNRHPANISYLQLFGPYVEPYLAAPKKDKKGIVNMVIQEAYSKGLAFRILDDRQNVWVEPTDCEIYMKASQRMREFAKSYRESQEGDTTSNGSKKRKAKSFIKECRANLQVVQELVSSASTSEHKATAPVPTKVVSLPETPCAKASRELEAGGVAFARPSTNDVSVKAIVNASTVPYENRDAGANNSSTSSKNDAALAARRPPATVSAKKGESPRLEGDYATFGGEIAEIASTLNPASDESAAAVPNSKEDSLTLLYDLLETSDDVFDRTIAEGFGYVA